MAWIRIHSLKLLPNLSSFPLSPCVLVVVWDWYCWLAIWSVLSNVADVFFRFDHLDQYASAPLEGSSTKPELCKRWTVASNICWCFCWILIFISNKLSCPVTEAAPLGCCHHILFWERSWNFYCVLQVLPISPKLSKVLNRKLELLVVTRERRVREQALNKSTIF